MVNHSPSKTAVLCLVVLSALLITSSAFAERISVSPAADGYVACSFDASVGPHYSWSSTGTQLPYNYSSYTYGIWDETRAIVEIPISSLQGRNLDGVNISFNFCSLWETYLTLYGGRYDGDGAISSNDFTWSYTDYEFSYCATVPTGWVSFDAAEYVKAQLASGYSWAIFTFRHPYGEGKVASAEDGRAAYLQIGPVPEPSSLLALFAGASSLGGMIIRRRK